ncbi:unnamed protein product, partial [Mesorhabditis belari]|uniref:Uncharacterized protein n=1 Tax=Mesorhabditis belari TaxID=2138241 RepID=A0AAF3FKG4_9BILA
MADLLPTSTLSYDDWANKTLEELIEYSLESSPFRDFECPLRYAILPSAWIFITTVPTLPNGMPIRPENRPDSDLPVIAMLAAMLITNLISLVTYLQRQILRVDIGITPSNYKQKILGQYYYVTLPQMIFRDLQTLCVLLFNLPPRQPKHQPPILSKQSASNGNIATIKVD